ncbi:MAG: DUF4783 domain-containing protein, partial [Bacteroidota bacterium]
MKTKPLIRIGLLIVFITISIFASYRLTHLPTHTQSVLDGPAAPAPIDLERVILNSLQMGEAGPLQPYLARELTLSIVAEEDFYRPAEAISQLNTFFRKQPAKKVFKKHGGVSRSGTSQYLIIQYESLSNEAFRCTFGLTDEKITRIEIISDQLSL